MDLVKVPIKSNMLVQGFNLRVFKFTALVKGFKFDKVRLMIQVSSKQVKVLRIPITIQLTDVDTRQNIRLQKIYNLYKLLKFQDWDFVKNLIPNINTVSAAMVTSLPY